MVWISALTHLLSAAQQGRDTPHTTHAELLYGTICSRAAIWCCEERALHSTMQSTMNLNRLLRQGSQDSYIMEGSLRKKVWYQHSLKGPHNKSSQNGGTTPGTLPRGWKQSNRARSNSLVDYTDPQRTTIMLQKQDNETFGFEIQTYGMQLKKSMAVEMCTFVCKVQEDSSAESAGLTAGDVIITINGLSIEGSSHQRIVDLIRESANLLRMETVCGTAVKRIELEKKMSLLKQTLRERRVELQALRLQENCLMRGNLNDSSLHPSMDSLMSPMSLSGHSGHRGHRFSSDSSCQSGMTEDSDLASVFGDLDSPSPCSVASPDDSCFFSRDFTEEGPPRPPASLSRTRSGSLSSRSSSLSSPSPTWDASRASSLFGTLPRKARRASVRKHILKFIPGFNHSVEEEDT
ncbi:cytohesin-interacting protein-like [Salvelinus namaycush]|uniref:Cytohesin-interacting protein-like n=1 Tax=Salvelinus namaycush TaxID=8040 RepID=A0A8U1C5K5_SALNM|nr:cytohesin-interacting protein-like [Salvelinus namaycush]